MRLLVVALFGLLLSGCGGPSRTEVLQGCPAEVKRLMVKYLGGPPTDITLTGGFKPHIDPVPFSEDDFYEGEAKVNGKEYWFICSLNSFVDELETEVREEKSGSTVVSVWGDTVHITPDD